MKRRTTRAAARAARNADKPSGRSRYALKNRRRFDTRPGSPFADGTPSAVADATESFGSLDGVPISGAELVQRWKDDPTYEGLVRP